MFYQADIVSSDLEDIFRQERPDVVNHHAGQISVPFSVRHPERDVEINLLGLIRILTLGERWGVSQMIFASSEGALYGPGSPLPTPETCCPNPVSPYGINKWAGERYLVAASTRIPCTILRYAKVYGPRQGAQGETGVTRIFIDNLLQQKPSALYVSDNDPRGMTRDYVFVSDVAEANVLALGGTASDVFHIGTAIETYTA